MMIYCLARYPFSTSVSFNSRGLFAYDSFVLEPVIRWPLPESFACIWAWLLSTLTCYVCTIGE